jgi:type II secretory pathway pseudopilin PulG
MARARSQQGFTLVELLVAMMTAMIVVGALLSILFLTLTETTRTFNRVDATQRARTAFDWIENELHSACIAAGVTPIQGGANGSQDSDDTHLVFVSQEGTSPTLTPVEHQITFANGTLTDTTYAVTGSTPATWTFSSSPTATTTLLTNVQQQVVNGYARPVFRYFAYGVPTQNSSGTPYVDAAGNDYMILLDGSTDVPGTNPPTLPYNSWSPQATPLTATAAESTAEVRISLVVGPGTQPSDVSNLSAVDDTVTDSVVLRLTPVADDAGNGATFAPCQ